MLIQIEFITSGSSTVFGNFGPRDRARVKPDMAKHLVEEARCARYVEQQQASAPVAADVAPPPAPPPAAEEASSPRRPRARRSTQP